MYFLNRNGMVTSRQKLSLLLLIKDVKISYQSVVYYRINFYPFLGNLTTDIAIYRLESSD